MVRFIDYQNCRQVFLAAGNDVMRNLQQKLTLVLAASRESQITDDVLQEFDGRQTAVKYVRVRDIPVLLQRLQQTAEQESLAGSNLSGQDDEAFAPTDAIEKSGQGFIVPSGRKQERRIRRNLERIALQAVKGFVHGEYRQPRK